MYSQFSDIDQAYQFLDSVRLSGPTKDYYEYPLDLLHEALPFSQKSDLFYYANKLDMLLKERRLANEVPTKRRKRRTKKEDE